MVATDESIDIGVKAGDVLVGKYRVERVLGAGGMGVVVAAHHIQLDEKVALKFLLPEALRSPEAAARFLREAQAAVKIKSEHVARVSDVGQLESGAPYMVMEYLEGGDLSGWLEDRGPMPAEQAVEFVLQACEAIAEAHALGIVHRDLKPANLFCVRRADTRLSVKVLDFGISKVTGGAKADASMTRTTSVMGSPMYMSPEQMQASRQVDSRTDIWSLGVILFELLSGRLPFEAEAVTELAIKIATLPPESLRSLRPEVPIGLEQVVLRCLEKDRERRFPDVGALATALEAYGPTWARPSVERICRTVGAASGSGGEMVTGSNDASPRPPASAHAATVSAWTGSEPGARTHRKKGALIMGSAAAVVVLLAGAVIASRTRAPAAAEPAFAATMTAPAAAAATLPSPRQEPSTPTAPAAATLLPANAPSDVSPIPSAPPAAAHPAPATVRAAPAHAVIGAPKPAASAAYNPLEHL